jgi:hypothetical protein
MPNDLPNPLLNDTVEATLQVERLLHFNQQVIDQALALVSAHERAGAPAYARPVGAHLRHVVEHFEALLQPALPGVVDYDQRPRDAALERSTQVARQRLLKLKSVLSRLPAAALQGPVQVRGRGGLGGEFSFEVPSSIARELVFVASHAVHHYAVLQPHCQLHDIVIGDSFGRAPATVAHERAQAAAASH